VEELYQQPRNQENLKKWEPQPSRALDNKWRGVPVPLAASGGQIPIVVSMEPSLCSSILGYNVREYFQKPEVYLENYLKNEIFHFTEIQDDVPIPLEIPVYHTAYFEGALCGIDIVYLDDYDAILLNDVHHASAANVPLLKDLSAVEKLPMPSFKSGKAMSYALQLYDYILEQVRGRDFRVPFVEWLRNPFGVATWLYGEQEFANALTSDPEGAHRLMDYATRARKKWTCERARFLGEKHYMTAGMYSDSVGSTSITPAQYLEFVQPYEFQIADLHGGIYYWHSCGSVTRLLKGLSNLPLELFHVGPWTDVRKAAEVFGPKGVPLEICVQKHWHYGPGPWPTADDVLLATPKDIEKTIEQTVREAKEGGGTAFCIEAGPLPRTHSPEEDIRRIKEWVRITRDVLEGLRT